MSQSERAIEQPLSNEEVVSFREHIWQRGQELYRDFPWRNTTDPYEVLVSEVMLQQTQTARVLRYYDRFVARFPNADALAAASASDVLEAWQGLGYNRRALALKRAAEEISARYAGKVPLDAVQLQALPGIGPSTAAGVLAFSCDAPSAYVETNVRAVFIAHFFEGAERVSDKELIPYVIQTCPERDFRRWYYALLDYGAYLKQTQVNPTRVSSAYARQSAYEGSRRQKRAELLRIVLASPEGIDLKCASMLLSEFERKHQRGEVAPDAFESLVADMVSEGFFAQEGSCLKPC